MIKIKRALISVSDKTGLADLAGALNSFGVEILSTGGTAKLLREQGIPVKEVSGYTGFPEMLDGRVKTLHPKIHGGLLALRENPQHMETLKQHNIGLIDMVVVNLYPFEKTVQKSGVTLEEAIENIDIGGPSMLRSAAKNNRSVAVICDSGRYPQVIAELKKNNGSLNRELLWDLATDVFKRTSAYDGAIFEYLSAQSQGSAQSGLPEKLVLEFVKLQNLRYGENPHQQAVFYKEANRRQGIFNLKQLQGKELSFNNILDLNAAYELVKEFKNPAAVIVKHNNPCGAAEDKTLAKAYYQAWKCDQLSAFGGVVALNRKMDAAAAKVIAKSGFLECIIAPGYDPAAREFFKDKKNLRLIELPDLGIVKEADFKRVCGGLLMQDKDVDTYIPAQLKVVTKKKPTQKDMESLLFAWKVAKHVKSNAIVLVRGKKTVGIGAGQMSRVDSVYISTKKAGKLASGSVLASDAFFPKEDAIALAAKYKIKAIIQPGGSIADEQIIKTADKYKIAMVTTGMRHFRH